VLSGSKPAPASASEVKDDDQLTAEAAHSAAEVLAQLTTQGTITMLQYGAEDQFN
jgi:hypothetical protein